MLRIKAERLRRGWSQQDLGYRARVQATDISRIERGRFIPYDGQAERLARVLGLTRNELLENAAVEALVS
jgi:ribosome-binding protein aMBF1 (putative translation factor)